jgi:hypothetical protein
MNLDFSLPYEVSINMKGFIEEMLSNYQVKHINKTPAGNDLFSIDESSPLLNESMREEFHSRVASVSYCAKRIKPAALIVTSFLATRVHKATEQDWEKLNRLLGWINYSKDEVLRLQMLNSSMYQRVIASIDASYGVHEDMRGHSGYAITLGGGVVQCGSTKQKLNVKSSAECELVAVSDGLSSVIKVQNILEAQGIKTAPILLLQDNLSTIQMMHKGIGSNEKTKHIKSRYFWIQDLIKRGVIEILHVKSGDMVSDPLTKPLQGEPFCRHNNKLINKHY